MENIVIFFGKFSIKFKNTLSCEGVMGCSQFFRIWHGQALHGWIKVGRKFLEIWQRLAQADIRTLNIHQKRQYSLSCTSICDNLTRYIYYSHKYLHTLNHLHIKKLADPFAHEYIMYWKLSYGTCFAKNISCTRESFTRLPWGFSSWTHLKRKIRPKLEMHY